MFAQLLHSSPIKILYGLIRFAQHCTAPYKDILCLGKFKKTFAQHCTAPYVYNMFILSSADIIG